MQQSGESKRAVFLDRDGVINRVLLKNGIPHPPKKIWELEIISGVKEAVSILRGAGYELIVVTNQPDITRGTLSREDLGELHRKIADETGLEYFFSCVHDDQDNCDCRKPKPGLLLKAAREMKLDLRRSFLVGDRWKDIQAGQEAGCSCFFIDYGYKEQSPSKPFSSVASLYEVALLILEKNDDYADK